MITLYDEPIISEGDIDDGSCDFTRWLDPGETLINPPVITEITTTDLTITLKRINEEVIRVKGRNVAIGCAAQWRISGQEADDLDDDEFAPYALLIQVTTTAGRVKTVRAKFWVADA